MRYPTWTIYTDNLPPDVGGCANGPVVRIRTKYRDDAGIHAHEAEHVRQWWMGVAIGGLAALAMIGLPVPAKCSEWWQMALIAGCALHPFAYGSLSRYRLWAEARAYRIQLKHYPDDRSRMFAGFIASKYQLNISVEEAVNALRN